METFFVATRAAARAARAAAPGTTSTRGNALTYFYADQVLLAADAALERSIGMTRRARGLSSRRCGCGGGGSPCMRGACPRCPQRRVDRAAPARPSAATAARTRAPRSRGSRAPRSPGGSSSPCVDAGRQPGVVAQHAVHAQHVGDEVVGEDREPVEVVELGDPGEREVVRRDLGPLPEADVVEEGHARPRASTRAARPIRRASATTSSARRPPRKRPRSRSASAYRPISS